MRFGLQLPYIVPFQNREALIEWCECIENGPFSTLMTGERIVYDNLDQLVTLSAAAVLTTRPQIFFGLSVLPLHAPAVLAKRVASLDVLSGGRVALGVGVGGRVDDYAAAEQPMSHLHERLDRGVATMKDIWSQRLDTGGGGIGPSPVQSGGPPLYAGARGPRSLARAARWADGYFGGSMPLNAQVMAETATKCKKAWSEAGRQTEPYLIDAVWFALDPDGQDAVEKAAHRYWSNSNMRHDFKWKIDMAPCYDEDRLRRMIDAYEAAGWDELVFIPTSTDITQAHRLAAVLESRT
jgi:alkanesulfonate monooxygenase SsuD/methylene tetrahydromethanopterin reductase-like flavin-dependent oxidoreductase (luciferase family)